MLLCPHLSSINQPEAGPGATHTCTHGVQRAGGGLLWDVLTAEEVYVVEIKLDVLWNYSMINLPLRGELTPLSTTVQQPSIVSPGGRLRL